VSDIVCPQGHPMLPGQAFCSECGASRPAVLEMSSSPLPMCANGHMGLEGEAFCAQCGDMFHSDRVPTLAARSEYSDLPQGLWGRAKQVWTKSARRTQRAVLALALALGLIVGALLLSQTDSGSNDASTATPDITATDTNAGSGDGSSSGTDPSSALAAHDECTRDVYNAAADIIDNPSVGYQRELLVGGRQNPVFNMAITVYQAFEQSVYQVGKRSASQTAFQQAGQICTQMQDPNNSANGGTPYQPSGG
jgi:hypothetical protein